MTPPSPEALELAERICRHCLSPRDTAPLTNEDRITIRYVAEAIQAHTSAIRAQVIEECARVADRGVITSTDFPVMGAGMKHAATIIAAEIRALKESKSPSVGGE